MEATAIMQMSWTSSSNQALSTRDLYDFGQNMSAFLMESVIDGDVSVLGLDNNPFKINVGVLDQSLTSDLRQSVDAIVSCLYTSEGVQVSLDTVLMRYADATTLPYEDATLSFRPHESASALSSTSQGPTKADIGLIVISCFLTVMLVVVSSVLLYVTGGWDACQQKCSSCCFEEVDDDYIIDNKSTFQVGDNYDENEDGSIETGIVTTMGAGVLGAQLNMDHPANGLGVHTPARTTAENDTDTPISMSHQPLGITSMRKLQPNSSGGLNNMVMSRMTNYQN